MKNGLPINQVHFSSCLMIRGRIGTSFSVVASEVADDCNQGVLTRDFLRKEPINLLISLSSK